MITLIKAAGGALDSLWQRAESMGLAARVWQLTRMYQLPAGVGECVAHAQLACRS